MSEGGGSGAPEPPPHYLGHRQRLRERFLKAGAEALPDYELLELLLFRALPRRDVKPLAKALLGRFGSFAETIAAPIGRLTEVEGLTAGAAIDLKIVEAARGAGFLERSCGLLPHRHGFLGEGELAHPLPRQAQRLDRR